MIKILVDDRTFYLSEQTLRNHPNFIITMIINNSDVSHPLVGRIDDKTFIVDADPDNFSIIVQTIRGINQDPDAYSKS